MGGGFSLMEKMDYIMIALFADIVPGEGEKATTAPTAVQRWMEGKTLYQSPISIYETAMQTIMEQRENAIFAKVQDAFDVQVDKAELIRALQYDRGQYEKGYRDAKQEQKWIPVSERLPEKDGIYLTFNKKKQYEFHFFQTRKRMWPAIWDEDGVTHWMPLPEPPKEE